VAILNDYESRWALTWQPHHQDFDYVEHLLNYYRPLATRNIPVDILSADQDLTGYRVVIAPALHIMDTERAERLKEFVRRGGSLVLTLRSAMKDRHNSLLPSRQPGPLRELAGVEVEEYYALDEPVAVEGNWFNGQTSLWAERLKPLEGSHTAPVATYRDANNWLNGQTAITVNALGSGMIYYVGAYLDRESQLDLIDRILQFRNIKPLMVTPPGVEVCRRATPDGLQIGILINHTASQLVVALPWPAIDHLSRQRFEGDLQLEPYGVAVITRSE
jgi:beta-galactosidase